MMSKNQLSQMFIKEVDLLDCAYFDPKVGIIGASYYVDLVLRGETDENGFVEDFSIVKKAVKRCLKDTLDHALILATDHSAIKQLDSSKGYLSFQFSLSESNIESCKTWEYTAPAESLYLINEVTITSQILEKYIQIELATYLPDRVKDISIILREERCASKTKSFFTYTHGLPGHLGHCQRLFHGHRSKLEIEVNGEPRPDLERKIIEEYFESHVHVATPEQIEDGQFDIRVKKSLNLVPIKVNYKSSFGTYTGKFPQKSVFVVNGSTSIESITKQIAILLKSRYCDSSDLVKVSCYEGINKGSIAFE